MISASFFLLTYLHLHSFYRSCFFAFVLSLTFLFPSFSLTFSFLCCLLTSSFYLSVFDLIFCFLWFFLRSGPDVLMVFDALCSLCSVLSHQFGFYLLFFSLIPFSSAFRSCWLSPRLLFFLFLSFDQSFFSVFIDFIVQFFFRVNKFTCSPIHNTFLLLSISLSVPFYTSFYLF